MMSILLSIGLVVYIILLIISCKNKGNKKIQIATQLVQGALWTLLAVDNWHTLPC